MTSYKVEHLKNLVRLLILNNNQSLVSFFVKQELIIINFKHKLIVIMKISLMTILIITVLFQCKNSEKATQTKMDYKTIASEKLGANVNYSFNEDNSLVLCYIETEVPNKSGYGVSFLVIDINTNAIIYDDNIDKGTASWYSKTQLALFYTPGIMRQDQSRDYYTTIYDLIKKTRTPKKDLAKN